MPDAAHHLSADQARQVAVRAQLLDAPQPDGDVVDLVRHLTLLQVEPTSAVAPSADAVAWSRLGSGYDPDDLTDALESQVLLELDSMIRPAEDLALFRAELAAWPHGGEAHRPWHDDLRAWVEANNGCRRDVLALLRTDGPLPASALPDTCEVPWRSGGWNNGRNLNRLLAQLCRRGEVAVAGHDGPHKLFDLAERVYPDEPVVPLEEAYRTRADRTLRSLGLARPRLVGEAGEPATVEGVRGRWRLDPDQLARLDEPFVGRAALLSPLDRLVFDRTRMGELFDFDYQLEMYKPAAKRRWGYWAMPVLGGDRLIGKVDATADHAAGELRVDAVHEDDAFAEQWTAWRDAVDEQLDGLGHWLGLPQRRPRAT